MRIYRLKLFSELISNPMLNYRLRFAGSLSDFKPRPNSCMAEINLGSGVGCSFSLYMPYCTALKISGYTDFLHTQSKRLKWPL